jgi:Tol biopolymer transport system component
MPDFDTRRPQEQDVPNEPGIGLVAHKLRTALMATRLRVLLIGGGILLFVAAVPVVLLIYSPSWLGDQQEGMDSPLSVSAADCSSQRPFVVSYAGGIRTMSLDGSHHTSLTTSVQSLNGEIDSDSEPAWSPDCKRIAFTRIHEGAASASATPETQSSIYVMNADGSSENQLLDANASGPTWSPDGEKIAFVSGDIYVMNADGSGQPRRITDGVGGINLDWSPDGEKIAFERSKEIYVAEACCELSSPEQLAAGPGGYREPVWSPDGTELAFTRSHHVKGKYVGWEITNTDVYKMDADGSRKTRLTHTNSSKHPEHDPVWSPSGDQLAFIRGYGLTADAVNSNTIYLMNSDGSQPTVVKRVPGGYEMDLDWR